MPVSIPYLRAPPFEVIVVDNASTDGSVEMVRERISSNSIVGQYKQRGLWCGGKPGGAERGCDLVLVLNSDTLISPRAWKTLGAYLAEHPCSVIVGPRILNADGTLQTSCFPFPGALDFLLSETSLAGLIQKIPWARRRYLRTWDHNQERMVPWVLGAALMIRKSAFESVNGFDPSFFMYLEEVDLCYRLSQLGWQVHFTPRATITHLGGTSTNQYRAAMEVQLYLSRFHFYRKHYARWKRILFALVVRYVLQRNLIRDQACLRRTADSNARLCLGQDIVVWRHQSVPNSYLIFFFRHTR